MDGIRATTFFYINKELHLFNSKIYIPGHKQQIDRCKEIRQREEFLERLPMWGHCPSQGDRKTIVPLPMQDDRPVTILCSRVMSLLPLVPLFKCRSTCKQWNAWINELNPQTPDPKTEIVLIPNNAQRLPGRY